MTDVNQLITDHLDIWTAATEKKSSAGRGNGGAVSLYGIKKLRALVLELAVRGKLVPQDACDGAADTYLGEIFRLRAELVRHGRAKKLKKLPAIQESETPFEPPKGWVWVRLQDISGYIQRGKSPKYADNGCVQVISQKCVQWGNFDLGKARLINDESLEGYGPERFLRAGDLLWNSTGTGTVGRVLTIEVDEGHRLVADSHVTVVRSISGCPKFLEVYLASAGIQDRIEPTHERSLVSGSTKQVELNTSTVNALPIPLPPLSEQQRIVAKVNELMGLCDALERQAEDSLKAHQTLVETCLATLTNSKSPEDLTKNWTRIEAHFDTLFITVESIVSLRATVLELGLKGLLEPQIMNSKSAEKTLNEIQNWREEAIKEKRIRAPKKSLPEVTQTEIPSIAPPGWAWLRLGNLIYIKSGDGLTSKNMKEGNVPVYGGNGITGYHSSANVDRPTIVIGRVGYYCGSVHITPASAWVTDNAFETYFCETEIDIEFLALLLGGTDLKENENATAQPVISGSKIYPILVGLPPLKEQLRIVEKLHALFALCDEMSENIPKREKIASALADTLTSKIY